MNPIRLLCFAFVLLVPVIAFCQNQVPAGVIEDLTGSVFWKKSKDSAEVRLDVGKDLGKKLYGEERLKCDAGAKLTIYVYEKSEEIKCPSGWFPIPATTPAVSRLKHEALEEYGRPGGRERSEQPGVFSPSDGSKVMAAKFEIRWPAGIAMREFSLVALDGQAKEIWKESLSNDSSGRFVSSAVRDALKTVDGTIVLKWQNSTNQKGYAKFTILPAEEEARLQQEISQWDKEKEGLMSHLGRASVFMRHQMFSEAADEYEAALKMAPQSRDLLQRTAAAHYRTGNYARQEELAKQIQ